MFLSGKIPLTEFFPKDFVDIHSHLIPGIDDGAKTIEESLELIKSLSEIGIKKLVTTPHIYGSVYPNSVENISEKGYALQQAIKANEIDSELNFAAEYMLDDKFYQLLDTGNLLTIGKNYILVELSYFQAPLNLHEILFKLNTLGFDPILAHPERYTYYFNKVDQFEKLKAIGCFFQLNLLSLAKHYGDEVYKMALKLLSAGIIDFVGTDLHRKHHLEVLPKIATKKHQRLLEKPLQNNTDLNTA